MDPSQFSSDSPGTLHFDPAGYWTYHPYPLPPLFRWTDRLVTALSAADRGIARLAALASAAPPGFAGLAARIEASASCRLDGFETDLAAVLAYEAGYRPEDDPPEGPADAAASAVALEEACRRKGNGGLGFEEMETLHAALFPREVESARRPGEFRRGQTWIGSDSAGPEAADFVPPPPGVMADALESLSGFIHADTRLPPLIRLALVHYQFEVIHPFDEANGRLGRLLNGLLLCRWVLLPGPVLALSVYFERHAERYRERIAAVSRANAVEDWLVFFLAGLSESAAAAEALLEEWVEERAEYAARVVGERTAERLMEVIDQALARPYLNVGQLDAALEAGNFKSISRYVDRLVELGVLEETTGQKRHRVFRLRGWAERFS